MLLFMDGFDAYGRNNADITSAMQQAGYLTPGLYTPKATNDTATGVGYAMSLANSMMIEYAFQTSSSVVVGFRAKSTSTTGALFALLLNNGLGTTFGQLIAYVNGSNGLTFTTQDQDTIAQTPPNAFTTNVWHYLEIKYTPSPAAGGLLQVKIDGVIVLSVSGVKTSYSRASAGVNMLCFSSYQQPWTTNLHFCNCMIDDLYLCDQTGASFNTFLGDVVVHAVFPNADAGTNDFAQTGGGTGHYMTIVDVPPDGDTSYLSSNVSGKTELFTLSTLPTDIVDVLAVAVNITARKNGVGTGTYEAVIVTDAIEGDSTPIAATPQYLTSQTIYQVPPGGGAWNTSLVQNAQIGFKIA